MPARPEPQVALGKAIRRIRLREKLTQEDLAFRAGYHPTWISRVERGTQSTGWATAKRLADALGVTMVELAALAERLELD
jgi:transcriptional regulator with XRE-family HTH domain